MTKTLNTQLREQIADALILHKFGDCRLKLLTEIRLLARNCRDAHLGPVLLEQLLALPDAWVVTQHRARVVFAGKYAELNWGDRLPGQKKMPDALRFPPLGQYQSVGAYDRGHGLTERHEDLDGRWNDHVKEVSAARVKAIAALGSFRTVKALLAGWPEIKPFIPADALEQKTALPVVQTALLNDVFGLPVDEKTGVAA